MALVIAQEDDGQQSIQLEVSCPGGITGSRYLDSADFEGLWKGAVPVRSSDLRSALEAIANMHTDDSTNYPQLVGLMKATALAVLGDRKAGPDASR